MSKYSKVGGVILAATIALWFQGCSTGVEKYGDAPAVSEPRTAIGSILSDPRSYSGKEVVAEGNIVSQCPSGCFFILRDNTGQVYVELKGSSFSPLRQCSGSAVAVKGTVYQSTGESREIKLFAEGLLIGSGKPSGKGVRALQCGNS